MAGAPEDMAFGPYFAVRRTQVGFCRLPRGLRPQTEFVAVRDEATGRVLTMSGTVDPLDDQALVEALCEATVYSGAFDMLDLVRGLAEGTLGRAQAEAEAKTILECLRQRVGAIRPRGASPKAIRADVIHKLGLNPSRQEPAISA